MYIYTKLGGGLYIKKKKLEEIRGKIGSRES